MASHNMRRSNSEKRFCTIPSHKCNSLDYYCITCYDSICLKCVEEHPGGHDMNKKKRLEAEVFDTNASCRKNFPKINRRSGRLQTYGSENSLPLYTKIDQAQFAVADDKETLQEDKNGRCHQEDICSEDNLLKKRTIEELKMKHKTIQQMYFGYRTMTKNDILLVVIISSDDKNIPDSYNGFQIYKWSERDISKEAENVMYAVTQDKNYNIPSSKLKQLKNAIAQNIEKLLNEHSNITIVSYCPIKSSRVPGNHFRYQDKMCIVIYCRIKGIIPAGEQPFPTEINGFPVDVREAYALFTAMHNDNLPKSNDPQMPLRIGAEIGISGQTGTLGIFVDLNNNQIGFITCAHVAVKTKQLRPDLTINNRNDQLFRVFQPSAQVVGNPIGYVEKAIFHCNDRFKTSIDAALVRITDPSRNPIDGFMVKSDEEILRFAGYSSDTPPCFDSGLINTDPSPGIRVMKCGASTGITVGMLCADGIYVRLENIPMHFYGDSQTKFEMYNQYDVHAVERHKLFKIGDSGAIVLEGLGQNLKVVGMAIGETSYGSAIVTPIKNILRELELPESSITSFRPKADNKRRKVSNQTSIDGDKKITSSTSTANFSSLTNDQPMEMTSEDTIDEMLTRYKDGNEIEKSFRKMLLDEMRMFFIKYKDENTMANTNKPAAQLMKEILEKNIGEMRTLTRYKDGNELEKKSEELLKKLTLSDDTKEQNDSDFSHWDDESIKNSDAGACASPNSVDNANWQNYHAYESKAARPKHSKTNKEERQNLTESDNDSEAAFKSDESDKDARCIITTPSGVHMKVNEASIEMSGGEIKTIHVRKTE